MARSLLIASSFCLAMSASAQAPEWVSCPGDVCERGEVLGFFDNGDFALLRFRLTHDGFGDGPDVRTVRIERWQGARIVSRHTLRRSVGGTLTRLPTRQVVEAQVQQYIATNHLRLSQRVEEMVGAGGTLYRVTGRNRVRYRSDSEEYQCLTQISATPSVPAGAPPVVLVRRRRQVDEFANNCPRLRHPVLYREVGGSAMVVLFRTTESGYDTAVYSEVFVFPFSAADH